METAFGRSPSLWLFPCGIKCLLNLWDNVVETKHINLRQKFYSCLTSACFTKEALRRLRFAFRIVHQWLMGLFPLDTASAWTVSEECWLPYQSQPVHSLMGYFWSYRHTAGQYLGWQYLYFYIVLNEDKSHTKINKWKNKSKAIYG